MIVVSSARRMHCPKCHAFTVMLLKQVSRMSPLNHYTCAMCGFAWSVSKEFESSKQDADDEDNADDVVH